jgi:SlyX protein
VFWVGGKYIRPLSIVEQQGGINVAEQWQEQMVELQSQMAFQEDAINALNEALSEQQREILILRRQVELLKQQQDEQAHSADDGGGASPADEKPPHY